MTEYELVYLLSEMLNRMWFLMQVWMGVAFAYMALAHFYGHTLNGITVAILTVAFLTFSLSILAMMNLNLASANGYDSDLRQIMEIGSLSAGTIAFLEQREQVKFIFGPLFGISLLLTLLCATFYMPYKCYMGTRAST
ncbi:MAG: hypothetical protein R3E64_09655 [Halioglobus sp.]